MSRKFLIVGQLPPPVHGSNLMTELFHRSLRKIGYRVLIVQKTFSGGQEDVGKVSITKIFKVPLITANLIYRLVINKPDLCFYFISIKPPSFFIDALFLLLIRLLGVKYVLCLHGKGLLDLEAKLGSALGFIVRKTISHSLGALVLGERLKLDVNKYIPSEHLFVLPNAIADISPDDFRLIRGSRGPVKILFLSNIMPSKGPMEFLKMAARLLLKRKDVRFILAGPWRTNHFEEKIRNYIKQESLGEFIEMPGGVYGAAKEKLFLDSDIFVFPTHHEAFGLVNLEAMRAGLPVISSDEGSIPEVVIDGLSGYIVDPRDIDQLSDRVMKLVNDEQLRSEMGKAGRKIYEEFYTTQAYEKTLDNGVKFFLELAGLHTSLDE